MESVSASDFVRRFGEWQERAVLEPIYIRHHGRTRFVLASVEHMGSLTDRPAGGAPDFAFARDQLLDLVEAIVILVDARHVVTGMSPQARLYFSDPEWRGKPLGDLVPEPIRATLLRSVQRVQESSYAETFEQRTGLRGTRRLDITVQPFADGLAIVARDLSARIERIETDAIAEATRESLTALGDVAVVGLNLRGLIAKSTTAIERMTGLGPEALDGARLVTLFDTASRTAVGDALEVAIRDILPTCVRATLAADHRPPRRVKVAFSAKTLQSSVGLVIATILAEPDDR